MNKQIILLEIANDLYRQLDETNLNKDKIKELQDFIVSERAKYRKEVLVAKNNLKLLDYTKAVTLRMILLILFFRSMPSDEILDKFKRAVNGRTEKDVFKYLRDLLDKHENGIEGLSIDRKCNDEIYIVLLNVLDCMGFKSVFKHCNIRDMSFIKENKLAVIADVCGLLEAYRLEQRKTIIRVNKWVKL